MKISVNNIKSITSYFNNELTDLYEESELKTMFYILLEHYFNINKIDALLNEEHLFSESELLKVIHAVKDLKKHKPLAYIIGEWEFCGLTIKVDGSTLIPRPETEELVSLIAHENPEAKNIIDIGTGSGCIALALKKAIPKSLVYAWDVSEKALEKVKENSILNNIKIEIDLVNILESTDKLLADKVDVIVSNPPYITENESVLMHKNVLEYEPHLALFVANNEPLLFYNAISDFSKNNLNKGGKLYFEINEQYGKDVKDLLVQKGFKNLAIVKDMNEKDRIVSCEL